MTLERWLSLAKREQVGAIGAELARAEAWHGRDEEKCGAALARALEAIDLTIDDPRWREGAAMLLGFRQEVAQRYRDAAGDFEILIRAL